MTITSTSHTVTFSHPFVLTGMDGPHGPGSFEVVVDRQTLDVSFDAFRITTTIMLSSGGRIQAWPVDAGELESALAADAARSGANAVK